MSLAKFRGHKNNPDFTYISLAALLILFGLVMISSSSVVLSSESYNQNYAFVIRQLVALGIGVFGAIVLSQIDYRKWRQYAPHFIGISLFLSLLLFVPGIGTKVNGAVRWINLGFFQLQPSELLKLSAIIYLAAWFEKKAQLIKRFDSGFLAFAFLLLPVIGLMMIQKDLGTLLVILVTSSLLYFVAGANYSHIGIGLLAGVALIFMLILIAPYRLQRLNTFRNPGADTLGAGYHINQSYLAIGSGGLWGRGFGKSLQKYLYLPEPHTDSIFAITVEELGFVRSSFVLVIIGLFAYRGYQIASRAADNFGKLVAFGITSMLLFQAIINIGAIIGLVPLTGVPLPLISYGGTSLVSSLLAIGIMANISKYGYHNG